MFAPSFDYYRARSVADAQKLWKRYPEAKLVAGGHSLIPLLKLRLATPPALIDIGGIAALKGISTSRGLIRIGALTTHAEIAASADLHAGCPMLAEAAGRIGDAQVRSWGTIGGNVAHADPASDLPTVLLALNARFAVTGPGGKRTIAAGDFFHGLMTTALGAHEILTGIELPAVKRGEGMAYVKFTHPASRYAVVGVAACVALQNDKCAAARVAIGGATPSARRASQVEQAIVNQPPSAEAIAQASSRAAADLGDDVLGDVFASADYRKAVTAVYVKRALTAAFARITL
jgi:aerobic carbon-monoxide dehydrogenase medium subunit